MLSMTLQTQVIGLRTSAFGRPNRNKISVARIETGGQLPAENGGC